MGKDAVVGPGLMSWDMGFFKNFPFREHCRIQFRAEFFNVFNHANFGLPLTNGAGSPVTGGGATFGAITNTTTTSRQIQLALKLLF